MKKRDVITLIILVVIFLILFIFMAIFKDFSGENPNENDDYSKLVLLSNEDTFLDIEKNINRIYTYANTNEKALNYIMKSNINAEDYKIKSFKAKEIYVTKKEGLHKYFIKGNLYRDIIDEIPEFIKEEYFVLNYDKNNNTYNIEIIDPITFLNASQDKHIFETINKNDYNTFESNKLSNKSRAIMYFNDFLNKVYLEPEKAYNLLTYETRDNYFKEYEEFKNYFNKYDYISLTEYSVNDDVIGIKDNYGNEYILEIEYILEYEVTINIAEE